MKIRNPFKRTENRKEETYIFNDVKGLIDTKIKELKKTYPFLSVTEDKSFKHFIDRESYHFRIVIEAEFDKIFLKEKYRSNSLDFPIEFDIDVEHATKEYVNHVINDIFSKKSQDNFSSCRV